MSMKHERDGEYIICPHCGEKYGDCWEWVRETDEVRECDECGKSYRYWAEYDVTYHACEVSEE